MPGAADAITQIHTLGGRHSWVVRMILPEVPGVRRSLFPALLRHITVTRQPLAAKRPPRMVVEATSGAFWGSGALSKNYVTLEFKAPHVRPAFDSRAGRVRVRVCTCPLSRTSTPCITACFLALSAPSVSHTVPLG